MTEIPQAYLAAAVAQNMRRLRKGRGWTAERLVEKLAAAGVSWNRIVVAKLENGRRSLVTVDELAALGAVFGVEPWSLVVVPTCAACSGWPPPGFRCLSCGSERAAEGESS